MLSPTERVRACERSKIRVMFDLAEAADRDLVRLEVGEPDFDTPAHIVEAATEAAQNGQTHYTSNAGLLELREAIADTLERDYDIEYEPDQFTVTNGGMEALHLAVLSTIEKGEELLIPSPSWPNYWMQARLADGVPVEIPMAEADDYALDAEKVIDRMSDETGAVLLCSPSNPTGQVYDPEPIREVVAAAAEHDAYVIADEVYLGLVYDRDPVGIAALTGHPDNVLTVGSCSKTYAMTGWRVGWLGGPTELVDEATKIHESTTACAGSIAQHAALAALTGPQEPIEEMYDAFAERREYVAQRVAEMEGVSCPTPNGAFYALLNVDLPGSSLDIAKRLLREQDVVLAPGNGFGEAAAGKLRLSFASSLADLEKGLDGIERAVQDA